MQLFFLKFTQLDCKIIECIFNWYIFAAHFCISFCVWKLKGMATKNHEEAVIARNSLRILVLEKIQIHFEINGDKWQFIPN